MGSDSRSFVAILQSAEHRISDESEHGGVPARDREPGSLLRCDDRGRIWRSIFRPRSAQCVRPRRTPHTSYEYVQLNRMKRNTRQTKNNETDENFKHFVCFVIFRLFRVSLRFFFYEHWNYGLSNLRRERDRRVRARSRIIRAGPHSPFYQLCSANPVMPVGRATTVSPGRSFRLSAFRISSI